MKNLGINRPAGVGAWGLTVFLALAGLAAAQAREPAPAAPPPKPAANEIIFSGKSFCLLKRPVFMPFPGTIASIEVRPGQLVRAGDPLASYKLQAEALPALRRRLSGATVRDLEVRVAEVDRKLAEYATKQKSVRELARQDLASSQSLQQLDRDVQLLQKEKKALQESLKSERQVVQDDLTFLKENLGSDVAAGHIPATLVLRAPINGHIVWMSPEMREGAVLTAQPVFQIGHLDPMVIRAQVHELEAMQLAEGDRAEVTFESLPNKKFEARLTRLPWAPLTPALDQPSYYDVEFKVDNPDLVLKEGLKARIALKLPKKTE